MKIRRDAVELLQLHQMRNEVEGQVESLSSSLTALQEQRTAALERMRDSQEEEIKLYHIMKAAVKKVSSQAVFSNIQISFGGKILQIQGTQECLYNINFHWL